MLDRVPTKPGRVLITPEDGSAAFYATMTRADEPTQEGSPLNKITLLSDAAAGLFGFDGEAVPDNIFRFLGKYNLHWWLARPNNQYWKAFNEALKSRSLSFGHSASVFTLYCSDAFSIDSDGVVSLSGEVTEIEFSYENYKNVNAAAGKYFSVEHSSNYISAESGKVYYIEPETTASRSSTGSGTRVSISCYEVVARLLDPVDPDSFYYVQSDDRNAYEDDENAIYTYLGIPLHNAVTANIGIVYGTYIGTGTYGEDNPNSLFFGRKPLFVAIRSDFGSGDGSMLYGMPESEGTYPAYLTWSDVGLSWYSTKGEDYQWNNNEHAYFYFAILEGDN